MAGRGLDDAGDPSEDSLAELMAAAQAGDAAAYAAVLRWSAPFIARVARGKGVQADRLDDVVQEVLLTVHHARHTYDPSRPFVPWLRVIAQRRAVDQFRQQARSGNWEVHEPAALEAYPDPAVVAPLLMERAERAVRVRAAVAALPLRQREAVEHLSLAGMSLAEAASRTGRTKIALKVSLSRGLKALRQYFAKDDGHR